MNAFIPFTANQRPQSVHIKSTYPISSHQINSLNRFALNQHPQSVHIKWTGSISSHQMNTSISSHQINRFIPFTSNQHAQSVRIKWASSICSHQMNSLNELTWNESTQWVDIKWTTSISSHQLNQPRCLRPSRGSHLLRGVWTWGRPQLIHNRPSRSLQGGWETGLQNGGTGISVEYSPWWLDTASQVACKWSWKPGFHDHICPQTSALGLGSTEGQTSYPLFLWRIPKHELTITRFENAKAARLCFPSVY
jgi:hypothetical protein